MSFVECQNPLKMYPHSILESASIKGKYFDRLGYCGVCSALAFTDNRTRSDPLPVRHYGKPYRDSKINNKHYLQAGCDTL